MKIKFIKSPATLGLAYFAGDEAEFDDKQATELIESGYAHEVKEAKEPKAKKIKE